MKINEIKVSIVELAKGFDISKYNGTDENIMCYGGRLNCRPSYQRNFCYDKDKQQEVINTIFRGFASGNQFPLSIMYWATTEDGNYEILDGQQRTLTTLLYRSGQFTWQSKAFLGLSPAEKDWFDNYKLTVYVCDKDDSQTRATFDKEVLDWFQVINIVGEKLEPQELLNAIYSGKWLASVKKLFSNPNSIIFREEYETEKYINIKKGDKGLNRQYFLETVLKWRCDELNLDLNQYMSSHRLDLQDEDLFDYFIRVLNWAKDTFTYYDANVLKRNDWGFLYNKYHNIEIDEDKKKQLNDNLERLANDYDVNNKKGIIEYLFTNEEKYLNIRTFDNNIKTNTYNKQKGICPLCQNEAELNPDKEIKTHYNLKEMEADHIIPWSSGGKTEESNCCMLCSKHNKYKSAKEVSWLKEYMKNL